MNNVITFFSLMIISSNLFASDLSDITCTISHSGADATTKIKVSDSGNSQEGKWTRLKLDDSSRVFAVACGSQQVQQLALDCTIAEEDNQSKELSVLVGVRGLGGIVNVSLQDVVVYCQSPQVLKRLSDFFTEEVNIEKKQTVKTARTLTNDELSFCSGLQNFGSSLLVDQRAICVPFLKSLPRPLTKSELEYCERQYSVQGRGDDRRLLCTEEMM